MRPFFLRKPTWLAKEAWYIIFTLLSNEPYPLHVSCGYAEISTNKREEFFNYYFPVVQWAAFFREYIAAEAWLWLLVGNGPCNSRYFSHCSPSSWFSPIITQCVHVERVPSMDEPSPLNLGHLRASPAREGPGSNKDSAQCRVAPRHH